jgi:hypothetical protein
MEITMTNVPGAVGESAGTEGTPLNPNIRFTVTYLQSQGFNTVDSGDGKTHAHECDRDYAYVSIRVGSHRLLDEADRLYMLLLKLGVPMGEVGPADSPRPCIQATYDPVNGFAIIDLMYVDDDHFRRIGLLCNEEAL